MKILVMIPKTATWKLFFPHDAIEKLEALGEVIWNNNSVEFDKEELKERLRDADVCFTGWSTETLDREILEEADKLKVVAHVGASVTPIVSDYLYSKGIKVISGNFVHGEAVAEGVVAYILCSLRYMPLFAAEMQKGHWMKTYDILTEGLLDQKVGLVGFGAIARSLVKFLKPFRADISVYDPYVTEETLDAYGVNSASIEEIFSDSKIISVHAAKRPETYRMIDRRLLGMIRDGALFINTSSGFIVNENDLIEELRKNKFKAVLDVFESEPLPADSKLIGLDNAMLMPHSSGSLDRYKYVTLALIEDIKNFSNGKAMKNEISAEYASKMTCF